MVAAQGGIPWRIPRQENSNYQLRPANSVKTVVENYGQAPITRHRRVATLL